GPVRGGPHGRRDGPGAAHGRLPPRTGARGRELGAAAHLGGPGHRGVLHTWEGLGIEVFTALSIRWLGTVQQSYAEEHEELVAAARRRAPRAREIVKAHGLGCAPRA